MKIIKEYQKMICNLLCKEKEIKSFKRYNIREDKLDKLIAYLEEKKSPLTKDLKSLVSLYKANKNPYLEKYLNEIIWALKWK